MASHPAERWAVAVSGGGDSVALMHLISNYARQQGHSLPIILTVDHGLRPSSAKEAKVVATWARRLGLAAKVLAWRGKKSQAGIEAAAREARYRLMGAFLMEHRIATLFVGHNQDDQAETFLLRLARGSGLDGLAGMQPRAPWPVEGFPGLAVARPLLGLGRDLLRIYLKAKGHAWLDDPMNEDENFDRVKVRKMRPALAEAGLTTARIAAAAAHLGRARESLEVMTAAVLARAVRQQDETGLVLDATALAAAPREVGLRALASVLMAVGGAMYRPRFESLERLFDRIAGNNLRGGATLHGCQIRPLGNRAKEFGPFTLAVIPESPRKTESSTRKRG
ncbi:MAG TPA: tRNA lysidine(34) synthetase TilS [Rhizomicrobium sp.]|nr:tRNA lysidine(34) synthetase TilS [Rhizomicrobium sp.]